MAVDALKHRKVADETREKLLDLFKSGHSPATALESHRYMRYVVALVIAGIFHFSHTRGQTNQCDPQLNAHKRLVIAFYINYYNVKL